MNPPIGELDVVGVVGILGITAQVIILVTLERVGQTREIRIPCTVSGNDESEIWSGGDTAILDIVGGTVALIHAIAVFVAPLQEHGAGEGLGIGGLERITLDCEL